MKIIYKYLVAALVVLLLLVFFLGDWRHENGRENGTSIESSRGNSVASSVDVAERSNDFPLLFSDKQSEDSTVEEMMRKSRDYRVVYEELVRSGSPKARFYSQEILRRCFSLKTLGLREVAIVSSQQNFARILQQERCESFSSDELSFEALRNVGSDPRFSLGLSEINQEWSKAGVDKTMQKQVFLKALEANDALLLQYVGAGLLSQHRESMSLGHVKFNGESELDAMRLAWMAAVCEGTGTNCGPGDSYVVDACASMNFCEESRRLALRALVAHNHGEQQQSNFDTAYALFVEAIQSRNVPLFFSEATP